MNHKIPCPCDNTFTVEVPEEIDLDDRPEYLEEIINGTFMTFICPSCGKKHKPEFPLKLRWPSRNRGLEVIPERDRLGVYRRKTEKEGIEIVIGYPEMADRLAVLRDELEPPVVEALKYYLLLKAEETYPDRDISIWYQNKDPEALEFHLHGLREESVAITRVPLGLYEKTYRDYRKNPRAEPFASLRVRSYVSVQNMMLPEAAQ
jgi:hypothetical protein